MFMQFMNYTCPMHPEIVSNNPGRCPKCGMNLVLQKDVKPSAPVFEDRGLGVITWKSYMPLIVVIVLIGLTSGVLATRDAWEGLFSLQATIEYFMIGFFLVFAGFKLLDLKGFAEGYSTYDLLAQKVFSYGYVYPFIEVAFGLLMILGIFRQEVLWAEVLVMGFSGLGVAIKLARREPFMCACLGTFLKVPLTKITLIEDFGMAALAALLLYLA